MDRLKKHFSHFLQLLKDGEYKFILSGIAKRISSKNIAFGLRRDLEIDFQNPDALINLLIRELKDDDDEFFTMDNQNHGLSSGKYPNGLRSHYRRRNPLLPTMVNGGTTKWEDQKVLGKLVSNFKTRRSSTGKRLYISGFQREKNNARSYG